MTAELRLEEFKKWMKRQGYAETTIKHSISDLKAVQRKGMNTLSKHTQRHRRYALRLYKRFMQATTGAERMKIYERFMQGTAGAERIKKLRPSLKELAEELGVSEVRLRKEFRWWCYENHREPEEFLGTDERGRRSYNIPQEFVEYAREVFGSEKKIYLVPDGKGGFKKVVEVVRNEKILG